ncbi:sulfatase-like hydrolase/transferase [Ruficoccus amylovorans]|uniref:Sulfatase-like hydrolase/transferase n=1 Tax=Ruficoccus amylovorans TaxID=1804625 RepID=A0A842HB04_9BACT|nr:sulfatase-like hydrolase/transferase [Ruficoccus amylovorans]MBC2593460.1 sulfatase-like hydrolase/transferase [Ruficoccus amylovorans]
MNTIISLFRKFVLAAGATVIITSAASARKPNVIVILSDDQGYADVGFNGSKEIPTPALDSIAKNGVLFTNGYVTAPQCAPSRAGLLSGQNQSRFGRECNTTIDTFGLPDTIPLMPEYLREDGYATGIIGKWHLGAEPLSPTPSDRPNERGFDYFYGHLVGGTMYMPQEGEDSIPYLWRNDEPVTETRYLTHVFGEEACEFIKKNADQPFFLYLAFNAPHAPLQAPEDYLKRFEHLAHEDDVPAHCAYTDRMIAHPRQVYAAMVAAMDDAVGSVLSTLKDENLENDTLIFFLSDNGGPTSVTRANNEPLRGVKGDVLEGGVRVPFAMQWPSVIPAGQVIDTPVISLDILPTALAAAGDDSKIPEGLDGENLLPMVTGKGKLPERALMWRFPHPLSMPERHGWAIREGDWKVTNEGLTTKRSREVGAPTLIGLYELPNDITESNDLQHEQSDRFRQMTETYQRWVEGLPAQTTMSQRELRDLYRSLPPESRERFAPWAEAN